MNKILGIDLGTTNSVIAVMEGGTPTVISNSEGLRTTPSIVAYTKKEELLVGQIAKRQSVINPENTFFSIKRFIGSKFSEVKEESTQVSYKIKEDSKGNVKVICPVLNKEFSPEELSSQVLRKLSTDASKYIGQSAEKAVITVPAYFNDSQRQAALWARAMPQSSNEVIRAASGVLRMWVTLLPEGLGPSHCSGNHDGSTLA